MRVGDILVSLDGKDVMGATPPVALAAIEAARRRVSGGGVGGRCFASEVGGRGWSVSCMGVVVE